MSPTTVDDHDPAHPPPSAQAIPQQVPDVSACNPRNSTRAPASSVPRRHDRSVSHAPRVATHNAVDHKSSSSSKTHNRHTPAAPATSQVVAKPSASSSSAHPPPLLTSGVASIAARTFFDPWNSSSTGHQRAENRLSGSTSWRESRSLKLAEQYKGGLRGGSGKRVADTVGAGSEGFGENGKLANGGWEKGARGLRAGGQRSLAEVWGKSKASTVKRSSQEEKHVQDDASRSEPLTGDIDVHNKDHAAKPAPEKQIFRGLCFYINGSTMPLISDHKLKYVLNAHGASQSIALGRRTVTHVILGTTCGGGLAGSKLQKEIARTRGNAVKYVTVEWVLASVAASKRLPEASFSPLKMAPQAQPSARDALRSVAPPGPPAG